MLTGLFLMGLLSACATRIPTQFPARHSSLTGSAFYQQAAAMGWQQRDSFAMAELLAGNAPSFLWKLQPVKISDTLGDGKVHEAIFYVTPDYLSIGTTDDWARIPLTPMAAQQLADSFGCFLPTRKIVDAIYLAAAVRLEPVPLFAFRDSTPVMYQHHLIIEGQRKGRQGLIAGIKKDVVISDKLQISPKKDRVAIYGWHRPDGKPIQPLYTGHVNWYVDYSHGIRLVSQWVRVDGRLMQYRQLMQDTLLKRLICDEEDCRVYRYD